MDAGLERVAATDPWALALPVLAGPHGEAVPELRSRVADLRGAGARLFEVVVGTPIEAYGARLTFRSGSGAAAGVAGRVGLADHPWGVPDWIGLRTAADGAVRAKAYHRRPPLDATLVHRGLPVTARPMMASLSGRSIEVYAALPGQLTWERFASAALEPLGCAAAPAGVTVVPRAGVFGVSVRHDGDQLSGMTLFVDSAALRDDAGVEEEWLGSLPPDERSLHVVRVAAAATVSRTSGRRYRMLSWHYAPAGLVSRAVSLHSADLLADG